MRERYDFLTTETEETLDILAILKPLVNASETSLLAHKAKLEK